MTDPVPTTSPPSRRKLVIGSAAALGVAAVALVGFILPAEYGIDPTGIGSALGVTKLSEEPENVYLERGRARTNVLYPIEDVTGRMEARELFAEKGIDLPADAQLNSDVFEFELPPYQGIELKYELTEGAPMYFRWSAPAALDYDMHAHPFEGGEEMTESYAITEGREQTAVYRAAFTGIHGWYWENRTLEPVTITLNATGAFTASKIFDQAGEHDRPLEPPGADAGGQAAAPAE